MDNKSCVETIHFLEDMRPKRVGSFSVQILSLFNCDKGGGNSRRMMNKCDMGEKVKIFRHLE